MKNVKVEASEPQGGATTDCGQLGTVRDQPRATNQGKIPCFCKRERLSLTDRHMC